MSGSIPSVVTTALDLRLVLGTDHAVVVPATFDYDPGEPYAVRATFGTSDGEVAWVFGRELLDEGLRRPTGQGDVSVWPSRTDGAEVVCLSLSSPSGQALLEADRAALQDFLARSYRLVPAGAEFDLVDVDAHLAELLASEGGSASL